MSSQVRAAALLLTAALLVAATPGVAAEPGKDPQGRSEDAPGQNKHQEDRDWRLNLIIEDVEAINSELLRVIQAHVDAGVPVTVEPGPGLIGATLEDLEPVLDYLPSPSASMAAPQFGPGGAPIDAADCKLLIIGTMDDPPFLDPGIRPECLDMDLNLPGL